MKTRFYVGAAVAAMLSATAVNAQVLGGNVVGGLGGALSGGMRDTNVVMQGSGNGSFGGNLEAGSLRRSATDITGRATDRVRNTAGAVREHTRSGLDSARTKTESAAGVATRTAEDATSNATAAARQIDAATGVASSLASDATIAGSEAGGALEVAHQQRLIASPGSAPDRNAPDRSTSAQSNAPQLTEPAAAVVEAAGSGSMQGSTSASKNRVSANSSTNASSNVSAETRTETRGAADTSGTSLQR